MTSKRRLIILLHRIALCVLGCGAFGSASAAEVEPRCRILLGPLTFEKDQQIVNPRTLQLVVSREGDCAELEAIEVLFSPTWTKIGIVVSSETVYTFKVRKKSGSPTGTLKFTAKAIGCSCPSQTKFNPTAGKTTGDITFN